MRKLKFNLNINKEDLFRSIAFVLLFVLVSFLVTQYYSHGVMKVSRLIRSEKQFQNSSSNLDFLVLGDSHSLRAVDPAILGDSFNYSSAGENYMYTYYKFRSFVNKNKKAANKKTIGYMILPFDYHSFSDKRIDGLKHTYFWVRYVDFLEFGTLQDQYWDNFWLALRASTFAFMGEKKKFFGMVLHHRVKPTPMRDGFILNRPDEKTDFSQKDKRRLARNRAKYYFRDRDYLNKILLSYFERILTLAEENNIKVALVRYPVSKEYYAESTEFMSVEKFDRYADGLLERYENVEIFDYISVFFAEDRYFRDSDHLNLKGAKVFSEILARDLRGNEDG